MLLTMTKERRLTEEKRLAEEAQRRRRSARRRGKNVGCTIAVGVDQLLSEGQI